MKRNFIYIVCGVMMLSMLNSCHIYNKYQRPEVNVEGLFRDTLSIADTLATDSLNLGDMPWEELFTDPILQELIRTGLAQNSNLQAAMLQVEAAQAGLIASRLAYLPSLNLAPQGGISSFDGNVGAWTYSVPVAASWEVDLFGRILNSKRKAKVALLQSKAYEQAVRTQIVATIANGYYTLLMLDKQLEITEQTAELWAKSIETMKAMKDGGMVNQAAVLQSEANYYMILTTIPTLRGKIREAENALSTLLYQAPQTIKRGRFEEQQLPEILNVGLPIQLLANRPDVQAAEYSLATAYYTTNVARSAFYPNIVISGTGSWTNSMGSVIVDPAKMLLSAAASLVQPIFNRGAITANYKAAKAQQEIAALNFQQTVLNAGAEVSNALYKIHSNKEILTDRALQVDALERAVEATRSLMSLGTSTYLEVLTAQQSLLNAQLSQVTNNYECMTAVVSLYHALGGGREIEETNTENK